MNRRTFCSTLPFAGALSASPILTGTKTTIYVHDFTLTREKVAVFDVDGKTYGLRWRYELEEEMRDIRGVELLSIVRRFIAMVTGGTVNVQKRVGAVPQYEDTTMLFAPKYLKNNESPFFIKVTFQAGSHKAISYI